MFLILLFVLFASQAWGLTLQWDASTDARAVGYILYWERNGVESGSIDVGTALTADIGEIAPGEYSFWATCYDAEGNESVPSNVLSHTVEGAPVGVQQYPPLMVNDLQPPANTVIGGI